MGRYWLTAETAREVLAAMGRGEAEAVCSLDLHLSEESVRLTETEAALPDGTVLGVDALNEIAGQARSAFLVEDGDLRPIQVATDEMFYKLVPTGGAPTIEISGVQMHRTTRVDPFENAMASAKTVVRNGSTVLDTCGGLGYTAIAAVRLGAASVVSVDVDPHVRAIARLNPWSAEYFEHPAITLVDADSADYVASLADDTFDAVIHDPPRFSRAGHLYGAEFYGQVARVLRRRGRLFHYTGEPYSRGRGRSFVRGVIRRLGEAGFEVRRAERLQGVVAKPAVAESNEM